MSRQSQALLSWLIIISLTASGCAPTQPFYFFEDGDLSHYVGMATNIEYPDVEECSLSEAVDVPPPLTLENTNFENTWELSLQEAVRISLENSKIMRTLGGRLTPGGPRVGTAGTTDAQIAQLPDVLLSNPEAVATVYDPAIIETGPATGVEAALSEFDAQLQASAFWEKNDRPQNVQADLAADFFTPSLKQDLGTFQAGIVKRSATGGRYSLFSNSIYNDSNSPQKQPGVSSDWTQNFEAEVNQPLLQGAGTFFNRIAGPFDPFNGDGTPNFDGVVLARINTDIALADFEAGVRNLVNDIENTYWELYFAYRNLESRKIGRDSALETWKKIHALYVVSARGGEAEKEAQSREQYFFFRSQVESGLADLYRIENRLRYLMGLAATDGRLIRPSDEPSTARVVFDWHEIHAEAMFRSVELRQQKWRIKQRELELVAAKNLLLPRLDAVGRYRWLGLGDHLAGGDGDFAAGLDDTSAFDSLGTGDFQEWQLGLQFNMPIGFRRELSTVRNQQLLLARERVRLNDQELELSHQLADAIRDLGANYKVTESNLNRSIASVKQVDAVQAAYDAGTVTLDLLLDAQRRRADAESSYYRSLVDYNRGVTQVHLRKGSLLEYNGVYLAEGPWPAKAYCDAHLRARERDAGHYLNYGYTRPGVFSRGAYEQHSGESGFEGMIEGLPTEAAPEEVPTPAPTQDGESEGESELPEPTVLRPRFPEVSSGPRFSVSGQGSSGKPYAAEEASGGAFDWGTLSLDASGRKTGPISDAHVSQARFDEPSVQSQTSANHEPVAPQKAAQADRDASGWKRAQR